jgi:hypothetical protein
MTNPSRGIQRLTSHDVPARGIATCDCQQPLTTPANTSRTLQIRRLKTGVPFCIFDACPSGRASPKHPNEIRLYPPRVGFLNSPRDGCRCRPALSCFTVRTNRFLHPRTMFNRVTAFNPSNSLRCNTSWRSNNPFSLGLLLSRLLRAPKLSVLYLR